MRDEILEFFKKNEGKFVSGQEIADVSGVSRTAIWKHIQTLRTRGYKIESYTKKGYRLLSSPDLLSPLEMENVLHTRYIGKSYRYAERIDSTNTWAKKLALEGAKEGTVVVAEEQTGAKGRVNRAWSSPYAKGIWFSTILRPPFPPHEAPKCTLMAAVALMKAFRAVGLESAGIKWPNDILVNGKKLVGILTELQASMEAIHYIVIGIGTNVSVTTDDLPDAVKEIATSFLMEGIIVSRRELFASMLEQLEKQYEKVLAEGFESTLKEWREYSITLGKEVQVREMDSTYTGFAEDIDHDGNLLVRLPNGDITRVTVGDVSIRPVMA